LEGGRRRAIRRERGVGGLWLGQWDRPRWGSALIKRGGRKRYYSWKRKREELKLNTTQRTDAPCTNKITKRRCGKQKKGQKQRKEEKEGEPSEKSEKREKGELLGAFMTQIQKLETNPGSIRRKKQKGVLKKRENCQMVHGKKGVNPNNVPEDHLRRGKTFEEKSNRK